MGRQLKELEFSVHGRQIRLLVPASPDDILAEAAEGSATDPYWGKVWDSAPYAAECVLRTQWLPGMRAIELGCGCGLLGIAALLAGLDVIFSDHEVEAVELAVSNAQLNGFEHARGMIVDWNNPPDQQFDVLLANDVLYEQEFHEPLLAAADALTSKHGSIHIGDPGRRLAGSFLNLANGAGWTAEIFDADLQPTLLPSVNDFQWLVLKR